MKPITVLQSAALRRMTNDELRAEVVRLRTGLCDIGLRAHSNGVVWACKQILAGRTWDGEQGGGR